MKTDYLGLAENLSPGANKNRSTKGHEGARRFSLGVSSCGFVDGAIFRANRRGLAVGLALGAVLVIAALLLLRFGVGSRDPTWTRIQETRIWRVGLDPSFPPFENLDAAGQPVGLDVDLAHAIAATWGVQAKIVGVGFDELLDAVHAHRVDSALSALPIVPSRTREVAFSAPYVEAGLLLVVPQDSALQDIDGLAGQRLATEWGSRGDAEARALARRWDGDLALVLRESAPASLDAVLAGEAEAALVDAISLALYQRRAELKTLGEPVVSDPYVIVVPRAAPELLRAVNEALAVLEANGTLAEIRGRWLRPGQ